MKELAKDIMSREFHTLREEMSLSEVIVRTAMRRQVMKLPPGASLAAKQAFRSSQRGPSLYGRRNHDPFGNGICR